MKKYPKRHIYTIQQNQNLIKKFQYYGSSLKNPIFFLFFLGGGGGVCMKCFFRGGVKKGGLNSFKFNRGLGKRRGHVFEVRRG